MQLPQPFTGVLLLANLASEFISQPGHTGMMDTTSMCQGRGVTPPRPVLLLLVGRDACLAKASERRQVPIAPLIGGASSASPPGCRLRLLTASLPISACIILILIILVILILALGQPPLPALRCVPIPGNQNYTVSTPFFRGQKPQLTSAQPLTIFTSLDRCSFRLEGRSPRPNGVPLRPPVQTAIPLTYVQQRNQR
jgi:hypothetical protein